MSLVAVDVQSVVIPGTGHFVAEESPNELRLRVQDSGRSGKLRRASGMAVLGEQGRPGAPRR